MLSRCKSIAHPVLILIAQVPVFIAPAVIKRYLKGAQEFVSPVFDEVFQRRKRILYNLGIDSCKVGEQVNGAFFHRPDHVKFNHRFNTAVPVTIFYEVHYLLCRQKRQLQQLVTRTAVKVNLVVFQFAQLFISQL